MKEVDYSDVAIKPGQLDEVFGDASVKLPVGTNLHPDSPTDRVLDDGQWHDEWRAWQVRHGFDKPAPD